MDLNICLWISDNIEWIAPLIASIIIPLSVVFIANKHTEKQIKSQNIENHKPFITFKGIEYNYVDEEKHPIYKMYFSETEDKESTNAALIIKNIGYGIAKDIIIEAMPEQEIKLEYESPYAFNLKADDEEKVIIKIPKDYKYDEQEYSFKVCYYDLYNTQYPYIFTTKINPPIDGIKKR